MRILGSISCLVGLLVGTAAATFAADPIYSGPQVGEPLPPLPVKVLFNEAADPQAVVNLVEPNPNDGSHRLIVFVHNLTRPAVGLVRPLLEYAATRQDDGLESALIFLGEDGTALQQRVTRARHALPKQVPVALSPDGLEGPGAYGLNRNVTLTVLVASEGTVRANFAIVDPSIPVDLPKLLKAVCDVVGGEPPAVETLLPQNSRR